MATALSTAPLTTDLSLTQGEPLVAPVIQPASAPVYIAPVSVPMNTDPVLSPPPPEQFRGEGGTPYGSVPVLYLEPVPILGADGVSPYSPPGSGAWDPNRPAPGVTAVPLRPGEDYVMPVLKYADPTKPNVAPAVEQVTPPTGPVRGTLFGKDLSAIPFWAWLVAAAFIGSRVFRG